MVFKWSIKIGTVLETLQKAVIATHPPSTVNLSGEENIFLFSYTLNYIHFFDLKKKITKGLEQN